MALIFLYLEKSMARQRGSRTGRCQGCNHLERARIERLLATAHRSMEPRENSRSTIKAPDLSFLERPSRIQPGLKTQVTRPIVALAEAGFPEFKYPVCKCN